MAAAASDFNNELTIVLGAVDRIIGDWGMDKDTADIHAAALRMTHTAANLLSSSEVRKRWL